MRFYILRTLVRKETLRLLANRGVVAVLFLLVAAALLLSFLGSPELAAGGLVAGVRLCNVDYYQDGPLIDHLRQHLPAGWESRVRFRPLPEAPTDRHGVLVYAHGEGAIQVRPRESDPAGTGFKVWVWHSGSDGSAMAPFEAWFWRETLAYYQEAQAAPRPSVSEAAAPIPPLPLIEVQRSGLSGGLDPRAGLSTALVLFGLFFVCVYLLPSMTCEEKERGILLAQALSPASAAEILTAKFLCYSLFGLALAGALAGACSPGVLARPFFWLTLGVTVMGSTGIGLVLASLARTQRAAGTTALCYSLALALLLLMCRQIGIPVLPFLALEFHAPRLLHAAFTGAVSWHDRAHLAVAALLALLWVLLAAQLFGRGDIQ